METNKKIKNYYPFIILLVFCFLLTFLLYFSPLAQVFGRGHDSAIFATVGNALNQGRVLYTEIVDNKGPLLYLINAIGLGIDYDFGLFYIEFLFFFLGAIFAYKTAMLITKNNRLLSCLAVIFSMFLFLPTLMGGNFTEEYAVLFINIATYFVTKFLFNNYKLKWYELSIIGMCFAATFLLRANLCAFFLPQIIVLAVCLIKDKKFNELFRSIMFIIIGILIFIAPFLIYLVSNNALLEALDIVYFGVRGSFGEISLLERMRKLGGLVILSDEVKAFSIILFAFILFLTKPKMEKPMWRLLIIAFLGIVITLYANSLTGGPAWAYMHYFIAFVPILVIISSWLFIHCYSLIIETFSNKSVRNIIILAFVFLLFFAPFKSLGTTVLSRVNLTTPDTSYLVKYIHENTLADETIQVISVDDTLYYKANRLPTSKHIYFVGGFAEERRRKDANEIAADLYNAKEPAKLIIMETKDIYDNVFIKSLSDKDKFIKYLNDYYILDEEASERLNCNIYKRINNLILPLFN